MIDELNSQLDKRKLEAVASTTLDDIASAEIVFLCSCGKEQDVDNVACTACGVTL